MLIVEPFHVPATCTQALVGGSGPVSVPTPLRWSLNALFSARKRYWLSEFPFWTMRRFPLQSMALIHAAMVIPAVIFKLAELFAVTDCWLAAANARSDAPIRTGALQVGEFTSVPVLLNPEESAAVVPVFSSNRQLATSPLRTSPALEGVAKACVELALSPPALKADTT